MSMFAKQVAATQRLRAEAPVVDVEPVVIEPAGDNDPFVGPTDAEFDEQRERRNKEHGTARVRQEAPVDGADDNLTVPGTESEVEVVTGEHGDAPTVTTTGNDTDVDADNSDAEFTSEADDVIDADCDEYEREENDIFDLQNELRMLADAGIAIESFGFNPTAAAIMQSTNLLAGTALESMALESLSFSSAADAESQMALEALGEKIKEKAAMWSAKILKVAKGGTDKIMGVLEPLFSRISGTVKKLATASWDKAKEAGAVAKAHPFATASAVIVAIAAVAGIVAFVAAGAPAPGAKIDAMKSMLSHVVDQIKKIKFPGGKITAKLSEGGEKVVLGFQKAGDVAKEASLASLGWTQSAVRALGGQLDRVWGQISKAWTDLGVRGVKLVKGVGGKAWDVLSDGAKLSSEAGLRAAKTITGHDTHRVVINGGAKLKDNVRGAVGLYTGYAVGNAVFTAYVLGVIGVITTLFKLTRFVVVGGFRMIAATLRALTPHTA